jgi:hypothetical protein
MKFICVPEWIKCSEKMPEHDQMVIVKSNGDSCITYDISEYNKKLKKFYSITTDGCCRLIDINEDEISHWLSLPKLPKD